MDKDVNESDPRSNVHYLGISENKAWKKSRGSNPVQLLRYDLTDKKNTHGTPTNPTTLSNNV